MLVMSRYLAQHLLGEEFPVTHYIPVSDNQTPLLSVYYSTLSISTSRDGKLGVRSMSNSGLALFMRR